jgi:hypothetical protein
MQAVPGGGGFNRQGRGGGGVMKGTVCVKDDEGIYRCRAWGSGDAARECVGYSEFNGTCFFYRNAIFGDNELGRGCTNRSAQEEAA